MKLWYLKNNTSSKSGAQISSLTGSHQLSTAHNPDHASISYAFISVTFVGGVRG